MFGKKTIFLKCTVFHSCRVRRMGLSCPDSRRHLQYHQQPRHMGRWQKKLSHVQQQTVILPFVIHESRRVILFCPQFQKQNSCESNTLATLPAAETANEAGMSIGSNAKTNQKKYTYLSRPDDHNSKIIWTFRYHYLSIQKNLNFSSVVVCLLKYW